MSIMFVGIWKLVFLVVGTLLMVTLNNVADAQIAFVVEDSDRHLVFFEGENVSFVCSSTSLDAIQFSIFRDDTVLVRNNTDTSLGVLSEMTVSFNEIRFTVPSVEPSSSGVYRCVTIFTDGVPQKEQLELEVFERDSVQCRSSSPDSFLSTSSLELSCYFAPSVGPLEWYATESSGSSDVIPSSLSQISDVKSRLVSIVEPSLDPDPMTFSCQSSTLPSTGCVFKDSFVVYSGPFIAIDPAEPILSPGSQINVTCLAVSVPVLEPEVVFWNQIRPPVGIDVTKISSSIIQVRVDSNTTIGSILNANCCRFVDGEKLTFDLSIIVRSNSAGARHGPVVPEEDTSQIISIIVGVLGALTLVAIIFSAACIVFICKTRRSDLPSGNQESRLSQIYAQVNKPFRRDRGNDSTDGANTITNIYDGNFSKAGPVSEENTVDGIAEGIYACRKRNSRIGGYDAVNHGAISNRDESDDIRQDHDHLENDARERYDSAASSANPHDDHHLGQNARASGGLTDDRDLAYSRVNHGLHISGAEGIGDHEFPRRSQDYYSGNSAEGDGTTNVTEL